MIDQPYLRQLQGLVAAVVIAGLAAPVIAAGEQGLGSAGADPWLGPWAGTLRAARVEVDAGAENPALVCSAPDDCRGELRRLYRRAAEARNRDRAQAGGGAASGDGDATLTPRSVISMMAWLDVSFTGVDFGFELDRASADGYRLSLPSVPEYQSILAEFLVEDFRVIDGRTLETTFTVDDVTTTLTLTRSGSDSAATLVGTIWAPMLGSIGRMDFGGELVRRPIDQPEMLDDVRHRYKETKRAVRAELGAKEAKKSVRN